MNDNIALIISAVVAAMSNYDVNRINVIRNEDTNKFDVMYCSSNNSFAIKTGICDFDRGLLSELETELDKLSIGHTW